MCLPPFYNQEGRGTERERERERERDREREREKGREIAFSAPAGFKLNLLIIPAPEIGRPIKSLLIKTVVK